MEYTSQFWGIPFSKNCSNSNCKKYYRDIYIFYKSFKLYYYNNCINMYY